MEPPEGHAATALSVCREDVNSLSRFLTPMEEFVTTSSKMDHFATKTATARAEIAIFSSYVPSSSPLVASKQDM